MSINRIVPDKAFTHGGIFHADDVFSAALLKIINPNIVIYRGFDIPDDFDGLVFDIGFGEFDHHQPNNEIRFNGVPYAAFGKLWRCFGKQLVSKNSVKLIDEKFIQDLDYSDNTGMKNPLSSVIASFNPNWNEKTTEEECFNRAVEMATIILNNEIEYMHSVEAAAVKVKQSLAIMKNHTVFLDSFMPWQDIVVKNIDAYFVVYPSKRGGYCIQTVPKTFRDKTPRVPFPDKWLGASKEKLENDFKGLTFCHKSNFLASVADIKTAQCVIAYLLNQYSDIYILS